MPFYCYSDTAGKVVEELLPAGNAPESLIVDGIEYKRDYAAENSYRPAGAGWPITCVASAVHPSQAQELRDFFTRSGVPTEVNNRGEPIYRDHYHQKRALKCRGLRNLDSY